MELLKLQTQKVAGDQGVAGGEEELALRPGQLAVCGADAHLAV